MYSKKFNINTDIYNTDFFQAALSLCKILQKHNFATYLVGGCIRDLILEPKKIPQDIDLASAATALQIKNLFPQMQFVGEKFGVCLVQYYGFSFEIATFRLEFDYQDCRHPNMVLQASTFIEDSYRRDFSINALYYDPCKKILHDIHGGLKDLNNKSIKCVGKAQHRFAQDALRILRALRFAADLKFKLAPSTLTAIIQYAPQLKLIAKERILTEFSKVKNFYLFIKLLATHLALDIFFPNLKFDRQKLLFPKTLKIELNKINYIFLKFLLYISFFYKIKFYPAIFMQLQQQALTKKDAKLCNKYFLLFFLQSFCIEQKLSSAQTKFLFFIELMKIKQICISSVKCILKVMLYYMPQQQDFFNCCLDKLEHNYNAKIRSDIILQLSMFSLEKYYIQLFLDYYYFNIIEGISIIDKNKFILNNIKFIEDIFKLNKLLGI